MVCVLSLGSAKVARCTNLPDDMKSAAVKEQEEHLRIVGQERSVLRLVVDQARSDLPKMMVLGGGGNRDPSSFWLYFMRRVITGQHRSTAFRTFCCSTITAPLFHNFFIDLSILILGCLC